MFAGNEGGKASASALLHRASAARPIWHVRRILYDQQLEERGLESSWTVNIRYK